MKWLIIQHTDITSLHLLHLMHVIMINYCSLLFYILLLLPQILGILQKKSVLWIFFLFFVPIIIDLVKLASTTLRYALHSSFHNLAFVRNIIHQCQQSGCFLSAALSDRSALYPTAPRQSDNNLLVWMDDFCHLLLAVLCGLIFPVCEIYYDVLIFRCRGGEHKQDQRISIFFSWLATQIFIWWSHRWTCQTDMVWQTSMSNMQVSDIVQTINHTILNIQQSWRLVVLLIVCSSWFNDGAAGLFGWIFASNATKSSTNTGGHSSCHLLN